MTTSRPCPSPGRAARPRRCAACGDPITTIRSPGWIDCVAPRNHDLVAADDRAPRASPAAGAPRGAGVPSTARIGAPRTSNSTICTWPSAKTSVCTRRGTPIDARDRVRRLDLGGDDEVDVELSFAPEPRCTPSSSSGSTVVVAVEPRPREIIAETMFASSRDVQAITRSASLDPGRREDAPARAVCLDRVRCRSAARSPPAALRRDRRRSARARSCSASHDRRSDLAGADDEDLHVRQVTPPVPESLGYRGADEVVGCIRLRRRARHRLRGRSCPAAARAARSSSLARWQAASTSQSL